MTDWMETMREWEKVQLAKLAAMGSRWVSDPVGSVQQIPEDVESAGRNITAMTGGVLGDVASMVPGSQQSAGGQAPTSEDLIDRFGDREHFSYWPSMFAAPGPGEVKAGLKAMLGIGKEMSAGAALAQSLFHGTPHKFSKFELEKIGTGEGAQAYGHGLYFAESPGVAKTYQNALVDSTPVIDANISVEAKDAIIQTFRNSDFIDFKDVPEADLKEWLDVIAQDTFNGMNDFTTAGQAEAIRLADEIQSVKPSQLSMSKGHLYEVDIPDQTIGKMLDWDAPLSRQPDSVKRALADVKLSDIGVNVRNITQRRGFVDKPHINTKLNELFFGDKLHDLNVSINSISVGEGKLPQTVGDIMDANHINGDTLYHLMESNLGKEAASQALNEAGIPGIRFYDGASRGKASVTKYEHFYLNGKWYVRDIATGKKVKTFGGSKAEQQKAIALKKKLNDSEKGTRNIVVFNPDDITQVKRDGELVYKKGKTLNEVIDIVDKY